MKLQTINTTPGFEIIKVGNKFALRNSNGETLRTAKTRKELLRRINTQTV